jgi:hypothetical protein
MPNWYPRRNASPHSHVGENLGHSRYYKLARRAVALLFTGAVSHTSGSICIAATHSSSFTSSICPAGLAPRPKTLMPYHAIIVFRKKLRLGLCPRGGKQDSASHRHAQISKLQRPNRHFIDPTLESRLFHFSVSARIAFTSSGLSKP